jgi:hypothetical protein
MNVRSFSHTFGANSALRIGARPQACVESTGLGFTHVAAALNGIELRRVERQVLTHFFLIARIADYIEPVNPSRTQRTATNELSTLTPGSPV